MQSRRFPKSRKLILLLGDLFLITLTYIIATAVVLDRAFLLQNIYVYSGMLPIILIVSGLLMNINGLYTLLHKSFAEIILGQVVVTIFTLVLVMALSFFIHEFSYSRGVLLLSMALQWVFLCVWRYFWWRLERFLHGKRSVMLMGSAEECDHVFHRLSQQPQLDMELKYICTDMEQSNWRKAIEQVDVVVLCAEMRHRYKVAVINACHHLGKTVMLIPNTYEVFCAGVELDKIDDILVFRSKSLQPSLEVRTLKRLMDLVIGISGFIGSLPIMAAVAVAIKIFDPGPILYKQVRVGRYGKEFEVYKFRTMKVDAEKYTGPMLAQENDPRITPLGRFLRATRLDELPQAWNVIIGDMSLMGPRPERPVFVEQFTKEMPEYAFRHNVKPGMTGMAQVYGKYNTTAFDKLVYDLMYIEKCNIWTDLVLLIQTARVMLTKSATEGTGTKQKPLDIAKYDIGNDIYGDF